MYFGQENLTTFTQLCYLTGHLNNLSKYLSRKDQFYIDPEQWNANYKHEWILFPIKFQDNNLSI